MIVVDTNVISELMRERPSPAVSQWIASHKESDLRTTSVTVSEVLYGVERLPAGQRKDALQAAATRILDSFGQQVLSFDASAAREYAVVVCGRAAMGHPSAGLMRKSQLSAGRTKPPWRLATCRTSPGPEFRS
jgi:predicted nucleic acid-binding protein